MSANNNFVDDGNREMVELIELLETGSIRNSSENLADSECAENLKPADVNEVELRMHLANKLSEANIADELVRKVNERMQDLAILKQNYKDLTIQTEFDRNIRTVAVQVNRDDESTSPDEDTATAGSEQVPILEDKRVANEDIASAIEEISKLAMELSLPSESQKSIVQQIINTALLPGLPIILAIEPSMKPMAPAPQLNIHLLNDQVALTWSMLEEDLSAYEQMLSYQVYCCKETSAPPTPADWWKHIELTALPLPMTYIMDRFTAGKYYFAIRGIDVQFRVGPFSSPVPVIFDEVHDIKPVLHNSNFLFRTNL